MAQFSEFLLDAWLRSYPQKFSQKADYGYMAAMAMVGHGKLRWALSCSNGKFDVMKNELNKHAHSKDAYFVIEQVLNLTDV